MRIVAYTYEADFHCVDCTFKRFNVTAPPVVSIFGLSGFASEPEVEDNEGNPVRPVYSFELEADEVCGDCGEEIG